MAAAEQAIQREFAHVARRKGKRIVALQLFVAPEPPDEVIALRQAELERAVKRIEATIDKATSA